MTRVYLVLAGLILLAGSGMAMATDLHDPSSSASGLLELMRNNANNWNSRLQGSARWLFWSLATIDLVVIFGPYVLRNADMGEFLGELMRFVLTIGFFASLIIYSVPWSEAIINSFRQAGATAAGVGFQLTPGDMFSLGVELAYTITDVNTLNPGVAVSVAASAIIILLCFVFIAAFMMLTLIQAYVLVNASVILMAFGGSKFTREYAIAPIRFTVAVGLKLFTLTLLVGIVMAAARDLQAVYHHDNTSMFTLVGLAIACALLCKSVPELMEGMITGTSSSGGSIIGGMAAAGAAGAAAGAAAMHSVMSSGGMLGAAGKSVGDLLKSSGVGSGSPGASMNSPMSGSGGSSPRSGGPSPRVGGGMSSGSSPGPAPRASGTASSGGSSAASSSSPTGSSGSASKGPSVATMAHAAAEMGMKTFGTASSIAVPGMEGAESLSVGPPPTPPDFGGTSDSVGDTPENVIRPADVPVADAPTPQAIDTMSDLQQALNNRGKL